jgi:ABC-type Mn2+/Zn2+ transport system permease subunit
MIAAVVVGKAYTDERFLAGLLVGVICGLLGVLMLVGMQTTASNLENFEDYEKRVKERWPDA